jgi:hypothetical protein
VTHDSLLYALDNQARLVQLDARSGKELGYIQFTPAKADGSRERYWVAVDGKMVLVSFSDSRELIALGP